MYDCIKDVVAFSKDGSNNISHPRGFLQCDLDRPPIKKQGLCPFPTISVGLWLAYNQSNAEKGTFHNLWGEAEKDYTISGWFSGIVTLGALSCHVRILTHLRSLCVGKALATWRGHVWALVSQPTARSITRQVSEDASIFQLLSDPKVSPQHWGQK